MKLLLTLSILCTSIGAQSPNIIGKFIGTVQAVNETHSKRSTILTTTLPFKKGLYFGKKPLVLTDGSFVQYKNLGNKYKDSSWKHATISFRADFKSGQASDTYAVQTLTEGSVALPWFGYPILGNLGVEVLIGGKPVTWGLFKVGNSWGPLVREHVRYGRLTGSSFWVEQRFIFRSGLPTTDFVLRWGYSHPELDSWSANYNKFSKEGEPNTIVFSLKGVQAIVNDADQKVLGSSIKFEGGSYTQKLILDSGFVGFAQSNAIQGRLIHPYFGPLPAPQIVIDTMNADSVFPVRVVAKQWAKTKAFGPTGEIQSKPPELDNLWTASKKAYEAEITKQREYAQSNWRQSWEGCLPAPGSTGSQADFSIQKFYDILVSGNPVRLTAIQSDVVQELLHAEWHREKNGSPLLAKNHPDLLVWSGLPNIHISEDKLGQTTQPPWGYRRRTGGSWRVADREHTGHDNQHMSIMTLTNYALITSDPLALAMCDEFVDLWLVSLTANGSTHDRVRAPRSYGRTMQTSLWLYEITGREDLKQRMIKRMQRWLVDITESEEMIITELMKAHPTNIANEKWFAPWQESFCVLCNYQLLSVLEEDLDPTFYAEYKAKALKHAKTTILYGWGKGYKGPNDTNWTCGKGIAWNDGTPLPELIHEGENGRVNLYSGYNTWGTMAAQISLDWAPLGSLWRIKAQEIVNQALNSRKPDQMRDNWTKWLTITDNPVWK